MGRYAKENNMVISGPFTVDDSAMLSPSALTASVDDYNPSGFQSSGTIQIFGLLLSTDGGNYNLTGLAAPIPGIRSMIFIQNVTIGSQITIVANSVQSLAPNRFGMNGNVILEVAEGLWLLYNTDVNRWTEIARAI